MRVHVIEATKVAALNPYGEICNICSLGQYGYMLWLCAGSMATSHFFLSPMRYIAILLAIACFTCMCSAHVEPLPSLSISKDSAAFEVADHATRQIQGASHDDHDDHDHDHDHSTSARDEESHAHKHDGGHDDDHQEHVSAGEAERTIVTTPEQLQEAVQRGDEHIEVQKHLDLTGLAMQNCGGGVNCILGAVPATVKTIRVCQSLFVSQPHILWIHRYLICVARLS